MIKAVVFDLFGTLIDLSDIRKEVKRLKNILSPAKFETYSSYFKNWHRNNDSKETFLKTLSSDENFNEREVNAINKRITLNELVFFSDVIDALNRLRERNIKIYILTNSPPNTKKLFYKLDLNTYFDSEFWSCDIGYLKPEPEIFQYLFNNIKENKNEVILVGDSYKQDIQGAERYGIEAVLIDRDSKSNNRNKIQDLKQLLDFV